MNLLAQNTRRPSVGVGVIVLHEGKVLIGQRAGSHGEHSWGLPGGHLEWNESFEDCAIREVFEETGIRISDPAFVTATNDMMQADDKHYVTVFMISERFEGEVVNKEPEKTSSWKWVDWDLLPEHLFIPLKNLVHSGFHPLPIGMTQEQYSIIRQAAQFMRTKFSSEASGHDWWHIYRVWKNARALSSEEGGDSFVIELAALLHDIEDHKLHNGDSSVGARAAADWLQEKGVDSSIVEHVSNIVGAISFKGGDQPQMQTLEGKIVQDADRLEAIGATGIARVFQYSGAKGRLIYDPTEMIADHSIQHFYDKLLKLKDLMNTDAGRREAELRHAFLEDYLDQFYSEWNWGSVNGSKEVEKLVRDRIPDIIRRKEGNLFVRTAGEADLPKRLKEKLLEEVSEYLKDDQPEELIDILEVVYALAAKEGLSREELEGKREQKFEERGGFDAGYILRITEQD